MTAIAGNYYTLAIGRQTAKGVAQTTPQYKLKVVSGDISPVRDEIVLAETDSTRQQSKTIVVGSRVEGSPEFYVRPDDFGLLAYGLLGVDTISGTAPNYIHTATMLNSGAIPYFTIYKAIGGSVLVDQYVDCRITGMKIKGQAGQPLTVSIDVAGLTSVLGATDPVLAAVTQDPLVYPQVTTWKNGAPPGTVESFEIDISNNPDIIMSDVGMKPYDIIPGKLDVSGTMTLLFESDADYRKFHTGSSSGTTVATTQMAEALTIEAKVNANLLAQFRINSAAYNAYPVAPDPGGKPIRVAIGWRSQPDATTVSNYVELQTKNAVAAY